jgi:soluble lytic murein transglycosylase-like protein
MNDPTGSDAARLSRDAVAITTSPRRRLLPAAALGIAAPLLWLVAAPLREIERRREVVELLEMADCGHEDEARIDALLEAERRFGVDPALLVAVAVQESTCKERAIGAGGARGLLQLKPSTARDVARRHELGWGGAERLFEADYSILVGAAHLSELYEELGTWGAALSAYNLGEYRYRSLSRRRGGSVTSRYARSVLQRREDLEERPTAE